MDDTFHIESSVLPAATRVVAFRGTEAISRLYELEIHLAMTEDGAQDFDMADAVGAKATLTMARDPASPFVFHGMLASVELVNQYGSYALFRATLVPHLWQLTLSRHSRMFTHKSVPEILEAVLQDGGLASSDYELRLHGTYAVEEHVCQYEESHYDFICRWMEHEGMYFFFEQGDDGEKLVITDHQSFHQDGAPSPIRFHGTDGDDRSAGEHIDALTCRHVALPASVRLKDYDYTKPTLEVAGSASVSKTGLGEIHEHNARFFTPDKGKQLATVRAEALRAKQVVVHATGTAFHLRSGHTFTLEDHPREAINVKYLVTEVEHFGNETKSASVAKRVGVEYDDVYRANVTAIPADVQFRPERRTTWPRIYGTEHAVVDGPADSEYAQLDDHGRYAIKLHFDESGLQHGKASTWVRMLQPHGGGIEGWHFPLRKGTEVMVTFLGGDPDRPVIAGVVPNAHTPSPVSSGNHTKNVIQTGGRNRLELEDKAGLQRITMSTPHANSYLRMGSANDDHELILHTDARALLDAGQNWDVTVGGHLDEKITGPVIETYSNTKTERVTGVYDVKYSNDVVSFVQGTTQETFHGNRTTKSEAEVTEEVAGLCSQTYKSPTKITYGNSLEIHGKDTSRTLDGMLIDTVTKTVSQEFGATTTHIKGDWTQTIDGQITTTIVGATTEFWQGAKSSHTYGLSNTMNFGAKAMLDVSASAELKLSAALSVNAGVKLEAKASASITTSAACDINVKSVAFDQEGVRIATKGCGIRNLGTAIQLAGITIFS